MVGLGNAVGPFVAAGFTSHTSWRDTFYLLTPLAVVAGVVLYALLPAQKLPKEDFGVVIQKIDWIGIFLAASGTILLLIPISGVGTRFDPHSPMVIAMLILGGLCLCGFLVVEWKVARLPMIPRKCSFFA
jgi:MFS family permease